jgi:hypothetical protein
MWISMSRRDATEIHASINDVTVLYDYHAIRLQTTVQRITCSSFKDCPRYPATKPTAHSRLRSCWSFWDLARMSAID